jgi:hypothetical protein
MTTAFDTPVVPFTDAFTDLPSQWIEASTRALTASAELYTQTLQLQADAARNLIETYAGLGGQALHTGVETTERAEEATAKVARETGRATQRATRRTATATRRAVKRTKPAAKAVTPAAAVEPPIAGYDDLTAEDLVAKLPEQSQATLVQVAAYEQAHDKRTTVLERVAALTGDEPAPGYDELNADEVQKLLTAGDDALATAVRDYERRHKSRAGVLEAAARNAEQS